uniref:Transmembrane protein 198 n=1 Tax=Anthurium amnicola TaxID=1678845 RepID=A0A1D1Z0G6_9ARAE
MYKQMVNKSNFLLILTCLLGILFPLSISGQNNNDPTFGVGDQNGELTPHEIASGVILIVTGLIFCFFGRRVYRLTLFLIGFYIGTIIAMVALSNGEPSGGFGGKSLASRTIILIVSLAVGFVVGLLFMCCSTVAIWFLGALAGYTLALFLLAFRSDGLIHSNAGRIVFIIALTILGLLLACFFKDTLIILATAFIGAYAIILGIDLFARTGFAQSIRSFMVGGNHNIPDYTTNTKVYLMLAGMIAFFIVGSIFQFRYHRNYHFGPGDGTVQPESGKKRFQLPWKNRG